jgi:drug/metabolite transporter (DMT)-like permease
VAVVLGAVILGERFTTRAAAATVAIVTGVALIVMRGRTPEPPAVTVPEPAAPARDEAA